MGGNSFFQRIRNVAFGVTNDVLGERQRVIILPNGKRILFYGFEIQDKSAVQCYVWNSDGVFIGAYFRGVIVPLRTSVTAFTVADLNLGQAQQLINHLEAIHPPNKKIIDQWLHDTAARHHDRAWLSFARGHAILVWMNEKEWQAAYVDDDTMVDLYWNLTKACSSGYSYSVMWTGASEPMANFHRMEAGRVISSSAHDRPFTQDAIDRFCEIFGNVPGEKRPDIVGLGSCADWRDRF